MEEALRKSIERQAKKLLERQKKKKFADKKYQRRFKLRTGQEPKQKANPDKTPEIWNIHPHFAPIYCIKHSRYLAKVIWRKIQAREYKVTPAIRYAIPKDNGGEREIMIFSIPDAAVANLFNRKLRDRNRNLQSPFCYSYRTDRTIFDAVLQTGTLLQDDKVYVIQYDFSKYFDSISHDYIAFVLNEEKRNFYVAPAERYVIEQFLKHEFASSKEYRLSEFKSRTRGVPQGCSLSLFLSNIAAHELDKELERSNGMFVRFADDVVCTARHFHDAIRIEEAFKKHCHYSGISINFDKSPGICLLDGKGKNERREYFIDGADIGKIQPISEFDYIGHKFTRNSIKISSRGTSRIKARISKIIYIHLLSNLRKKGLFDQDRIGGDYYDWDFVTCINEIRQYMYGGLKEQQLRNFIDKNKRINRFKGLMSFYPLVTSIEQFAELDGWLVNIMQRAIKERAKLIALNTELTLPTLSAQQIISGEWYKYQEGITLETRAPSFVLAWRAARKAFRQYGLTDFEAPSYYSSAFTSY